MAELMPGAFDVIGQLSVEMGGESARIEARGELIVVELPSLRAGGSILRRLPGRRRAIGRFHESLVRLGLTVRVDVASRTVGVLGVGARPGRASRLLGFGPLEVRVGGLLGSLRSLTTRPGR